MKKFLFWLLTLIISLPVVGQNFQYTYEGTALTYTVLDETAKTCCVTSSSNKPIGNLIIPSTVSSGSNNYSVISIGNNAFSYCNGLTSVTIPNSVTSIENNVFYECNSLTSVAIPNSVTSIGRNAFYGCSSLTSITIPNSVTSIGEFTFKGCSKLTSVNLSLSITSIGRYAFYECSRLTSITIPNAVTSIGESAFYRCSSLTSISISNAVTSIGQYAFYGCSSLSSISIPNAVTSIGQYVFYRCSSLTSISIPNAVTSIGESAFYGCSSLSSISIPNAVTSIGESAFGYCSGLSSISIPNSIASINNYTFDGCSNLTSVTIPNSVTSIGECAFQNCSNLTSITLPNSITSIGALAFRYCKGLTSMIIPGSVTSLAYSAFADCSNLIKLGCPNSLTKPAFNGSTITYNPKAVIVEDGFIFGLEKASILFVPIELTGEYVIPNSVTSIGADAFNGCKGLTSVTIPTSVTSIGRAAFYGCRGLTSVSIPNSVTSIGANTFSYCSGLTSVTIPNSITYIGSFAFDTCSDLTSVVIPGSVTSIGDYAFLNCNGLIKSAFPKTIQNPFRNGLAVAYEPVGAVFEDGFIFGPEKSKILFAPYALTGEYIISDSVSSVGGGAFARCSGLTSVSIPNSVTSIGSSAFDGCEKLVDINSLIDAPENCDAVDMFKPLFGSSFNYDAVILTVPRGTAEKYRAVAPWSNFSNIVEMAPEGPLASFSMADATMRMGETLTLSVNLNNSVDITSFQCDIRLPEGFEAVKNAQGKPVVKLGARKSRTHTISSNVMADGAVRVACFSTSLATFAGNEGELFTIEIQPVTATAGIHEVTIDGIIAAKPDAQGVNIEPTKCSITLRKALMPGDVNDDDVVNVSDAIAIVGHILGDTPENFLSENADINGDAVVNILDVTEVMRIVLGTNQASKAPAFAKSQKLNVANVSETEALYVENFEIKSGEEKLLPIKLRADRDYTGFQTDIYLPEGLEVMTYTEGGVTAPDVELNEESNSGTHILDSAMQKDGALRVISLSLANEMYGHSSDNTLFTVRVRVKPGFTASVTSPIYFRNTLFNTGKAESHFADSSSEIGINNHTTGIEDVIEHNNSKQYFNLQGMPVKNPTKGMIYILKTATSAEKVVF